VRIGLAPKSTFNINTVNLFNTGWYILLHDGMLYSQNGFSGRPYGSAIQNGDVIEVKFNVDAKVISFVINGVDKGVAFQNVNGELFPALDINEENVQIEMME